MNHLKVPYTKNFNTPKSGCNGHIDFRNKGGSQNNLKKVDIMLKLNSFILVFETMSP